MYRGSNFFDKLHFGFSAADLFFRLDPATEELRDYVRGHEVTIQIADGVRALRIVIPLASQGAERAKTAQLLVADDGITYVERARLPAAFDRVLEIGASFEALGIAPAARVELAVTVKKDGVELERYPKLGMIELALPDAGFEARHWSV